MNTTLENGEPALEALNPREGVYDAASAARGNTRPAQYRPPFHDKPVAVQPTEDQVEAATAEAESAFQLPDPMPSGLRESFALLATIEAIPAKTLPVLRAKAAALSIVKRNCHAIQQSAKAPHIAGNEMAAQRMAAWSFDSDREARLAELAESKPFVPTTRNPVLVKIASEPGVESAAQALHVALAEYETACLLRHDEIHPAATVARIERAMAAAANATERAALHDRLVRFKGDAANAAAESATNECLAIHEAVRVVASKLTEATLESASRLLERAVQDEAVLFRKWNLTPSPTKVSQSVREVIARLKDMQAPERPQPCIGVQRLPSWSGHKALQIFQ